MQVKRRALRITESQLGKCYKHSPINHVPRKIWDKQVFDFLYNIIENSTDCTRVFSLEEVAGYEHEQRHMERLIWIQAAKRKSFDSIVSTYHENHPQRSKHPEFFVYRFCFTPHPYNNPLCVSCFVVFFFRIHIPECVPIILLISD